MASNQGQGQSGAGTQTGSLKISSARFHSPKYLIKQKTNGIKAILIFNWETFQSKEGRMIISDRRLQEDANHIKQTLKENFDIEPICIENKCRKDLFDKLKEIANAMGSPKRPDVLMCFIIGRGQCDYIYECPPDSKRENPCYQAQTINLKQICSCFDGEKCRALVLRPKLFFAQIEWKEFESQPGQFSDRKGKDPYKTVPVESDFFVYCSHKSINDSKDKQSKFTELLCNELHGNVLDLTLRVNRQILDLKNKDDSFLPMCTCRLTKDMILPEVPCPAQ